MAYYDDPKRVEEYVRMAEGYDGRVLIDVLREHVADGASVLELGMGPGTDALLLGEHFTVTGSDRSAAFLERFREVHPEADLLLLDAVTLDTDRQFDAIYSNKVLIHLTPEQLVASLRQQARVLKPGGIALHAFWFGEGAEEMHGLYFAYYTEAALREVVGEEFNIISMKRYTEMEPDDSLYLVLKNKQHDES